MNRLICQLILCGALFGSGCSSLEPASPPAQGHGEVVLPVVTPFDSNPMARVAYLEAYRDGFRAASRGEDTSADFLHGAHRLAQELGWRAGVVEAQGGVKK